MNRTQFTLNLHARLMCLVLFLAGISSGFAQTGFKGQVLDEEGEPLIGANVMVVGAKHGTMTDVNGDFSINANKGDELNISYVGYLPQRVKLGDVNQLNIVMHTDNQMLDEVVVVGYGTMKKRDLTGSVSSVSGKTLKSTARTSTWDAMRGLTAGVNVTPNSGRGSTGFSVQIRGQNTINKGSSPLMVVDGVVGADINAINPADIERMDVLKDVSATAIYGSRGANGVILVTTKSGQAGKTRITYDGSVGFTHPVHLPEMFNGDEYVAYAKEAIRGGSNHNPFVGYEAENAENRKYFDWLDYTLHDGFITSHTIGLTGGTEKSRHVMSLGYTEQTGNVDGERFRRFNAKVGVEGNLDRFTLGLNMYGRFADADDGSKEALRSAFRLRPITQPTDAYGNEVFYVQEYRPERFTNPSFDSKNENTNRRHLSLYTTAFLDFRIMDGFNFRTTLSSSFYWGRYGYFADTETKTNKGTQLPKADLTNENNYSYTWDNTLNFVRTIAKDHSINAMIGTSFYKYSGESSYIDVRDLPYNFKWYNLAAAGREQSRSSGESKESLVSFMGRINYSWKDRYLLTLTGRYDGSSKLAKGHKWAFFPSAAIAWRLSQEEFMKDVTAINDLKIRFSYGESGNNAVGAYSTLNGVNTTRYDFGGNDASGQYLQRIPNYDLGWEKSKEFNLGVDFSLFNSRLSGSVELYTKKNVDLILGQSIPQTNGFGSVDAINIGSTRNKGIEVTLNSVNIQTRDFSWTTIVNFATNKNEVLDVYGDKKDYPDQGLFIGQPVSVIYDIAWDGIWQLGQEEEAARYGRQPGEVREVDQNGDGAITPDDRVILGNPFPDWTGGMTNTFTYKNFDLSVYIYTRQGMFKRSEFHANLANEYLGEINQMKVNYWTPENPSNEFYRPGFNTGNKNLLLYKDFSFWRIGNITLGYTLPEKWMKPLHMTNCRLYVTANNPVLWTKYDGMDPEFDSSAVYDGAVSNATYQFGVNVAF